MSVAAATTCRTYTVEKEARPALNRWRMCATGPESTEKLSGQQAQTRRVRGGGAACHHRCIYAPSHEQEAPQRECECKLVRAHRKDRRREEQEGEEEAQGAAGETREEAQEAALLASKHLSAPARTAPSGSGSDTPPPRWSVPSCGAAHSPRAHW